MDYAEKKKLSIVITAVFMIIVCVLNFTMSNAANLSVSVRNVELSPQKIDYQSVLNEFDNISDSDIEEIAGGRAKYYFSYNVETNIVTIRAEFENDSNEIIIDEISGMGFINEDNEIDAVMSVEDESILLSDMREAGLVENCGLLSRIIKKATGTVASTAVATVLVSTAGGGAVAVTAMAIAPAATNALNITEKGIAISNKNHNKKNSEPTSYINGQ